MQQTKIGEKIMNGRTVEIMQIKFENAEKMAWWLNNSETDNTKVDHTANTVTFDW